MDKVEKEKIFNDNIGLVYKVVNSVKWRKWEKEREDFVQVYRIETKSRNKL